MGKSSCSHYYQSVAYNIPVIGKDGVKVIKEGFIYMCMVCGKSGEVGMQGEYKP